VGGIVPLILAIYLYLQTALVVYICIKLVMRARWATMLGAYSLGAADLLADLLSVARGVDIVGGCGYILYM
jgi:hypothetical protein